MKMLLDIDQTPAGYTGGHSKVGFIMGGFYFSVVNPDYEQTINYNKDTFNPFYLYPDVYSDVTSYDISSTDFSYLEEVGRLKKTFNTSPSSTFNARGFVRKAGTLLNPTFKYIYVFDFNDVFNHSFDSMASWVESPTFIYSSAFVNYQKNITDVVIGGNGLKPVFEFGCMYSPVVYYNFNLDKNYHTSIGIYLFEYETHFSLLVPSQANGSIVDGKSRLSVSFNHYKIIKNSLCCLAQCFGIT